MPQIRGHPAEKQSARHSVCVLSCFRINNFKSGSAPQGVNDRLHYGGGRAIGEYGERCKTIQRLVGVRFRNRLWHAVSRAV
jgi:hypothetical protein